MVVIHEFVSQHYSDFNGLSWVSVVIPANFGTLSGLVLWELMESPGTLWLLNAMESYALNT